VGEERLDVRARAKREREREREREKEGERQKEREKQHSSGGGCQQEYVGRIGQQSLMPRACGECLSALCRRGAGALGPNFSNLSLVPHPPHPPSAAPAGHVCVCQYVSINIMSVSRAVAATVRCRGCRQAIVASSTSLAGIEARTSNVVAQHLSQPLPRQQSRRFTALSARRLARQLDGPHKDGEDTAESAHDEHQAPSVPVGSAPLPWYLQVQPQQRAADPSHPLAERQRLPDLPSDSPPILQDLLEHISVDLGLDDLALLDLRKLDPPPALGAGLLMIVGSARSEKHLHVSADRFCRWLRSTHKLSPYADGLLGRNELKLRMRRKAKRSKLMANVGASETSNPDDGIRTGWVCVNVGRVGSGEGHETVTNAEDSFVGFGRRTSGGVTMVVQMFTEEKRADIDIEGLWSEVLRRSNKRKEAKEKGFGESVKSTADLSSRETEDRRQDRAVSSPAPPMTTHTSCPNSSTPPPVSSPQSSQQRRSFHSAAGGREGSSSLSKSIAPPSKLQRHLYHKGPSQKASSSEGFVQEKPLEFFKNILEGPSFKPLKHASKADALRSSLQSLRDLSYHDARRQLGSGEWNSGETPFMRYFLSNIPRYPELPHWECVIGLFCQAMDLDHPSYQPKDLLQLLQTMQISIDEVPEKIFHSVLSAIARRACRETSAGRFRQSYEDLEYAFTVLDTMHDNGHTVVSESIFLLLHNAITPPRPLSTLPQSTTTLLANHQSRLRRFHELFTEDISLNPTSYYNLLYSYALQKNWAGFWDIWRALPRHFLSRSSAMYELLFTVMAETRHQMYCIDALRHCIPEMEIEEPKVELRGSMVRAVLKCLRVAEPQIETMAKGGNNVPIDGEWLRLWQRCHRAIEADMNI